MNKVSREVVCCRQTELTDKLGFSCGDALDRYDDEDEEEGEDGEAFRSACLDHASAVDQQLYVMLFLTTTPWSQAKTASSYSWVMRSQRAVMYPATKMPTIGKENGCM